MAALSSVLRRIGAGDGLVVVLTGAGVSAESGIPTFRGPEGYWRVGSRVYQAMELATHEAFQADSDLVWTWYLYRRGVCRAAAPNAAHRAIAELDRIFGERMLLITQNVDGLHLRAGSPLARTYQVHGNIDYMRCSDECGAGAEPIPDRIAVAWERGRKLTTEERTALVCPRCRAPSRPHVLWFDETYDEVNFRFESSLAAAARAALLIVVGTTGSTNLPLHVGSIVARRQEPIVVINPEPNPFTDLSRRVPEGFFLEETAGAAVPRVVTELIAGAG